jgi:hypothetical protein
MHHQEQVGAAARRACVAVGKPVEQLARDRVVLCAEGRTDADDPARYAHRGFVQWPPRGQPVATRWPPRGQCPRDTKRPQSRAFARWPGCCDGPRSCPPQHAPRKPHRAHAPGPPRSTVMDPPPPTDLLQHAAHLRTAWHPMLILLLEMLLPPDQWQVVAEYALTREPRRIDAVIVRRVDVRDWHPEYLRSLLDDLLAAQPRALQGRHRRPRTHRRPAAALLRLPVHGARRAAIPRGHLAARGGPDAHAPLSCAARSARRRAGGDGRARRSRRSRAGLRAAGGGDQRRVAQPGRASALRRLARVLAAAWCSRCAR